MKPGIRSLILLSNDNLPCSTRIPMATLVKSLVFEAMGETVLGVIGPLDGLPKPCERPSMRDTEIAEIPHRDRISSTKVDKLSVSGAIL